MKKTLIIVGILIVLLALAAFLKKEFAPGPMPLPQSTEINEPVSTTTSGVATTTIAAISTTPKPASKPANLYTSAEANYSIDLPVGWKLRASEVVSATNRSDDFFDASGKISDSHFVFSIVTSDRKASETAFENMFNTKPSTDDMVSAFIGKQEGADKDWKQVSTTPTSINGKTGYIINVDLRNGTAKATYYLVFTDTTIYTMYYQILAAQVPTIEPILSKSALTFTAR